MKRFPIAMFGILMALSLASPAYAIPVAVLFGAAAATSFVAIAVTALVNFVLTFAVSALINAVVGKPNPQRQASIVTLAIGEQPRTVVFGISAVPGLLE